MGRYDHYAIPPDHESLFPETGYGIVLLDDMKDPGSDEFINMVAQMDEDDFSLPPEQPGYSYYVHAATGETYTRDEWEDRDHGPSN